MKRHILKGFSNLLWCGKLHGGKQPGLSIRIPVSITEDVYRAGLVPPESVCKTCVRALRSHGG